MLKLLSTFSRTTECKKLISWTRGEKGFLEIFRIGRVDHNQSNKDLYGRHQDHMKAQQVKGLEENEIGKIGIAKKVHIWAFSVK